MPEMGDLAQGGSQVGPRFVKLAESAGLPALDLSPVLSRSRLEEISYPRDGHLKPEGNQLAAAAIALTLTGSAGVPPRS